MKKQNLSPAQQKAMLWLSQGWSARNAYGAAVEINGERVCNLSTMRALERAGLIENERHTGHWVATAEGRKLSPNYRPDQGE